MGILRSISSSTDRNPDMTPVSEQVEVVTDIDDIKNPTESNFVDNVKENDAPEYLVNKKTDEISDPKENGGILWRMSSGMYNSATGAVGAGIGGVKWVATKTYDVSSSVGSTVASYAKKPSIPTFKGKDKKE